MYLFFGDSLTAGENSPSKFTDFLPPEWDVWNYAVSGTTIGEYSIYPVDGNSFLKQIEQHQDEIKDADKIFIEYANNDVSAVMCGFATVQTVTVSFVKAIDWIRQLNPDVKIIFLATGSDTIIHTQAFCMCSYLEKDYFKEFNFKFPESVYASIYNEIISNIRKVCDIIYMFDDSMTDDRYFSDDNIHPNEIGHKRVALNILKQL